MSIVSVQEKVQREREKESGYVCEREEEREKERVRERVCV